MKYETNGAFDTGMHLLLLLLPLVLLTSAFLPTKTKLPSPQVYVF